MFKRMILLFLLSGSCYAKALPWDCRPLDNMCRISVPNGWLVTYNTRNGGGITFMPDQEHEWNW